VPTEYPSLNKLFLDAVDTHANPKAQMYRTAEGWKSISSQEMLRRVAGLSKALAELGIKSGDRVGLFAPNCPEWHIADFAITSLGAASVPIYFNESPDRFVYIMNDSGARIIITAGESQARKSAEARASMPKVEHLICVAPPSGLSGDFLDYESLISAAGDADVAEYRRRSALVRSDQLATLIYTSGTTGEPKGVMLTHSNLSSNSIESLKHHKFEPGDIGLELLPLSHVYERSVGYGYISRGVTIAYVENIESVGQALLEVHPTMAAAVPRLFEKIYAGVVEKGRREQGLKRKIFDWAMRVAHDSVPWRAYDKKPSAGLKMRWAIADKLVFSKIRAGLGGRLRTFVSGGAPLATELAEFYFSVGVAVYQGYGLTETSPVVTSNRPEEHKVGTVGRPIDTVQVRIADDGEILVAGTCVMQGYFGKPEATREVLSPEGWLATGDIGKIDADGYLIITDRKKELLKTAGGKYVAPSPIENSLKTSPYILNAIVVGNQRKFCSVLVVLNAPVVQSEAKSRGHEFAAPSQMLNDAWVRDLLSAEIERLTANLAQYEKPKRFALLEQDFTFASGELTYTLKMKRRVIEERYKDVIARLYADVEDPRPQARS
jgi:long-chain acyl-CoA synthetase